MKTQVSKLLLLCLLFQIPMACTTASEKEAHPVFFNTDEYVGFVSMGANDNSITMEYELDGVNTNAILFKNCDDVKRTTQSSVVTHQHHLWQLVQINCKAVTIFQNSTISKESYWPSTFDQTFIENLPATAIPNYRRADA